MFDVFVMLISPPSYCWLYRVAAAFIFSAMPPCYAATLLIAAMMLSPLARCYFAIEA